MATTKLNPIYAAIDAYQFNRAIKLASALPDSNVLGKALLAHSLTKAGQKHQALITLHRILIGQEKKSSKVFFELQLMLDQQNQPISYSAPVSSSAPTKTEQPSGKKGKKGKKKPPPKQPQHRTDVNAQNRPDFIDRLDSTLLIPETISLFPAIGDDSSPSTAYRNSNVITDETTLATLAVSLKALNLPLTAYQMYARAADIEPTELLLTKTFTSGISVLATPSTWNSDSCSRVEAHVLGHMQTVSLQLARVAVSANDNSTLMLATAWACQSALWQLEWLPDDEKRSLILPRLAESMARKLNQQENDRNQQSKEVILLYSRILKHQSKLDEILPILEVTTKDDIDESDTAASTSYSTETDPKPSPPSEFGVTMTNQQIKLEKASVMKSLNRYEEAQFIYEDLLKFYPDDWSCWKSHLECSISGRNNNGFERTEGLVNKAIKDREGARNQLRGPHLMVVEIAAQKLQKDITEANLQALGIAIQQYAETFARRANCTITDLDQYLNVLLSYERSDVRTITISLLQFAESLRKSNSSYGVASDNCGKKERLSKLRAYIFALKLTHKLVSFNKNLADIYLPDWIDVVKEWKATFSLNEGEEVRNCILT